MEYLVNSREMKTCDTNTIEHFKVPSMVLMERAALSVIEVIQEKEISCNHVLVVCGTGNNGGDGMAIARLLYLSHIPVEVYLYGNKTHFSKQAKEQYEILTSYGVPFIDEMEDANSYSLIIDALFGIGLSRKLDDELVHLMERLNQSSAHRLAVDIPSGVSADNGTVLGGAFKADDTVTFAYCKTGMVLFPGAEYCGNITVKDIGIGEESWLDKRPAAYAITKEDLNFLNNRAADSNKGTFGKVLLVAGSVNMAGAAVLAAKAAYRSGCGLVRIYTPEENRIILQTAVPEAVLTTYSAKKADTQQLIECLSWADVIILGPGIGKSDVAHSIVKTVLKNAAVPMVVDADALNIIAEQTEQLLRPHTELVLTPHLGEMSRLKQLAVSYIKENIEQVAEDFAREYNVICVLKDSRTVTAIPYGKTFINRNGNSGMATAGSGDVLSGIIGSLMAQGLSAEQAAPLGVYVHAAAADERSKTVSKHGLTAGEIINGLSDVLS